MFPPDLPYDTDIPDGDGADVPDNEADMEKQNALKMTRINAVAQVNNANYIGSVC